MSSSTLSAPSGRCSGEQPFAGDSSVELLRSADGNGAIKIVEIFKWNSGQAKADAMRSRDYEQMCRNIAGLTTDTPGHGAYTGVVRGFNANFPRIGGVELLRGVCSCLLSVDGMVQDYPMSVKNGIVLMHRSPRMDLDGDGRNEMYLKILMHGGELIQAALGPIRVEQNFARPNDGLVKSLGEGPGLPGDRHLEGFVEDPDGARPGADRPRSAAHFRAGAGEALPACGHALPRHHRPGEAGARADRPSEVGTLVPGELTAFDIVISKDDEIYADLLNAAPEEIFTLLKNSGTVERTQGARGCGGNAVRRRSARRSRRQAQPAAVSLARQRGRLVSDRASPARPAAFRRSDCRRRNHGSRYRRTGLPGSSLRVTLLEARRVGSGASGRNAGLMLAGASELEAPHHLLSLLLREQIDAEYQETGHLALAASPG